MDSVEIARQMAKQGFLVLPIDKATKASRFSEHGYLDATNDPDRIDEWFTQVGNRAIPAVVPGSFRATWAPYGFVVLDVDVKNGKVGFESLSALEKQHQRIPDTFYVETPSKGRHYYFKKISDRKISNQPLAKDIDIRADAGYVGVGEGYTPRGKLQEAADCPAWLDELLEEAGPQFVEFDTSKLDEYTLATYEYLLKAGWRYPHMMKGTRWDKDAYQVRMKRPLVDGADTKSKAGCSIGYINMGTMYLYTTSWEHNGQIFEAEKAYDLEQLQGPKTPGMGLEAYHGPLAEAVRQFGHTEADPNAILVALLVAFGNLVGRNPYVENVGYVREHATLFALVVGESSRARKSAAWSQTKKILRSVDPIWEKDCVKGGFGSGQIIVDALYQGQPYVVDGKGNPTTDPRADAQLVQDKRLLVNENEFARVLKTVNSEGSIYSAILRDGYDGNKLETRSRGKGHVVVPEGEYHLSLFATITGEELQAQMTRVEMYNGFGNRFLYVHAKRSKYVAFSESTDDTVLEELCELIAERAEKAKLRERITFSPDARKLWQEKYYELETDDPGGILGHLITRNSSHVVRMALIYALADGDEQVEEVHLRAALAVWDYCRASAEHIFKNRPALKAGGDKQVERLKAKITETLFAQGELGKTKLKDISASNSNKGRFDEALQELADEGTVIMRWERTTGAPAQMCKLKETS